MPWGSDQELMPADGPPDKRATSFFVNRLNLTHDQAQGAVRWMQKIESNLDPNAFNPAGGGQGALGIGQWRGLRQQELKKLYGDHPTFEQQLEFTAHELEGSEKSALEALRTAETTDEAYKAWGQYFERPGGGLGRDSVIGAGNWNVNPRAITREQETPDTDVVWMSPERYMNVAGRTVEKDRPDDTRKRTALLKSLTRGDDIEDIPSLDVKPEGNKLKVYDQDGVNRARAAMDAGVDLIPVAIKGVTPGQYKEIAGLGGDVQPYDFTHVPKVPAPAAAPQPTQPLRPTPKGVMGYIGDKLLTAGPTFMAGLREGFGEAPVGPNPLELLGRDVNALYHGIGDVAIRAGVPRDIVAIPEAFPAGRMTGAPHGIPPAIERAASEIPAEARPPELQGTVPSAGTMPPALQPPSPNTLAPMVNSAAIPMPTNALSPMVRGGASISPEDAMLAREGIQKFGLPITAADLGNPTIRAMASAQERLPFSGAGPEILAKKRAYNREVAKTMGEDGVGAVTREVMSRAKKRIGAGLDQIENSNEINIDNPTTLRQLAEIENKADALPDKNAAQKIHRALGMVIDVDEKGNIKGKTYGQLIHKGTFIDNLTEQSNPDVKRLATDLKDALRGALQQSLTGEDFSRYQQLRQQYKNMKIIEKSLTPTGDVRPAQLNNRVSRYYENRPYDDSGSNAIDRLGAIGARFIQEPGSSLTSERAIVNHLVTRLGEATRMGAAAGATGAAATVLGLPLAAGSMTLGLVANRLAGIAMRRPGLAMRTIDRALTPPMPPGMATGRFEQMQPNYLAQFLQQQQNPPLPRPQIEPTLPP